MSLKTTIMVFSESEITHDDDTQDHVRLVVFARIFQRLNYSKVSTDPKQHTARRRGTVETNLRGDLWQKVKGKVYEMTVRPAMMYSLETGAVTRERQEAEVFIESRDD